jgi:hypothetical protein
MPGGILERDSAQGREGVPDGRQALHGKRLEVGYWVIVIKLLITDWLFESPKQISVPSAYSNLLQESRSPRRDEVTEISDHRPAPRVENNTVSRL